MFINNPEQWHFGQMAENTDSSGGSSPLMERLGRLLVEESERQWLSFGLFGVVVLIGALWLHQAAYLPGVSNMPLLATGEELVDIAWSEDGSEALLIVDDGSVKRLVAWDAGAMADVSSVAAPNSVTSTELGWMVGADDGHISSWSGGGAATSLTMTWDDGNFTGRDILAIDSRDGTSGFMLTQKGSGTVVVRSFTGSAVSNGSAPPFISTVLTDLEVASTGRAIIIGYDTTWTNPTLGPAGEVIIEAETVGNQQPLLRLLHHSAGGQLHSVITMSDTSWSAEMLAIVAGSTSTLVVNHDGSVHELPQLGGSTAAAVDSMGTIWLTDVDDDDQIRVLDFSQDDAESHRLSKSDSITASAGARVGDEIQFYGVGDDDRVRQMGIETSARQNVGQSLALLGDFLFFVIAMAALGLVGWNFYYQGFRSGW